MICWVTLLALVRRAHLLGQAGSQNGFTHTQLSESRKKKRLTLMRRPMATQMYILFYYCTWIDVVADRVCQGGSQKPLKNYAQ